MGVNWQDSRNLGAIFSGVQLDFCRTCRANFWKNVLYINNLASTWGEDWCLPHTWYLDVEMQIFVFALPLVVIPMWIISRRMGKRDGVQLI